ncbi:hypothetical protein WMY93_006990 [Mugilogobius chulae]|uniref:NACHT domain-containing protein n=1 Tax=Mugilogobius chulae TaxID=88201 RepID=A0AAW0PM59_9GOBI
MIGAVHCLIFRPAPGTSAVSLKSDASVGRIIDFKQQQDPQPAPGTSAVLLTRKASVARFMDFKQKHGLRSENFYNSMYKSLENDESMEHPMTKSDQHQTQLDSVFKLLEDDIFTFIQKELKKLQKVLSTDYPECLEPQKDEDEEQRSNSEAVLKLTLNFLRRMKQKDLAERLSSRSSSGDCLRKLKSELQQKCKCVFEGITKAGNPTLLNQIYTELYITEGGSSEVNQEHEVRHMETASRKPAETPITCEDLFKGPADTHGPIRTVLTKGVAGIGKTVLTQKFSLDWAEGKANQDIQLLFPFTFRALNVMKDRSFSLVTLVHHFFSQTQAELCSFEDLQVLFIFDGLDECRLPLDFTKTKALTDPTESVSVDVLLVNLIRGSLLPSARLWITTRPAAANQIPAECVSMVTEVRGFKDPQKEQYFMKRFRNEANKIISHIKTSRSLHIMCHMPIFCWILSTVLEHVLKSRERGELPKTLTQMYIHFLVVQAKVKSVKFEEGSGTDSHWSPETRKMVESLGKLAFEQLQKGNLIFYESDLRECGLDAAAASVYSGVFTQVFREEPGLYQDKVYCFIHLSVQEFLAALHVHQTFVNTGINLVKEKTTAEWLCVSIFNNSSQEFYQTAVDQALQSPTGHLDLFLRFLLGLSLSTNQSLLQGLLIQTGSSSQTNQKTAEYIKKKLSEDVSAERSINLFHCLNELNDRSLVEQIQQSLRSGRLSEGELSPAQWSALAFILLSSEEVLDQFELKKYSASEEALLRLLPVVKASNKALLSSCHLSERSCEALSTVLSSQSCSLTVLDISHNNLKDSGLKMLSVGMKSPHCKLEQLRLSGCLVSEEGCAALASALRSNPSHLRELDLSYNHPGDTGVRLLSALQEDSLCALDTLRLEPAGACYLSTGPCKYFCELFLGPNTAHRSLEISDDNKKVTRVIEEQPYPDNQDRFKNWAQILCCTGLTGRCYWEVKWNRKVYISVSYRGIGKKGLAALPLSQTEHTLTHVQLSRYPSMHCANVKIMAENGGHEEDGTSKNTDFTKAQISAPEAGQVPLKSDGPMGDCETFEEDNHPHEEQQNQMLKSSHKYNQTQLDSIFKLVEADIFTLVQQELKKLQRVLSTDYPECLEPQKDEDEEQRSNSEAVLKLTLNFLRRMKQKDLAERLSSRRYSGDYRRKLKYELQQKCEFVFEGIAKAGNPTLLNQIYTELYITEGGSSEVNQEHEVRHMETASRKPAETPITCEDLFKGPADTHGPIRTVLTKGVAGIGKTVLTQKFSLDWAEGKANQDIQLLFPFTFRALNVMKDRSFSLVTLVHHFFSQTQAELCSFEDLQVLFIFDGLDECRLPLDFTKTKALTDPTESVSVDVLLVNLIRGSLLPSARLWITTRPAAANQIPAECVSMVTEVRGFKDPQKEQYFMKRFKEEANTIISHIKMSRSLHIMCHMPIFCWILSTVLEHVLKSRERGELPKTLTQMYIHFLVVQAKVKSVKFEEGSGTDPRWSPETRKMVESLGKLAFEQLQKGNLIFYESDLRECGLDAAATSVYSGVFTQVFREEPGLNQDKVYCFIHLSVQEFLAALHVHQTFVNSGINLLSEKTQKSKIFSVKRKLKHPHQTALDQALQSPNGHLDLFLRFLLGLSLPSNQRLLQGLLTQTESSSHTHQETVEYIKKKLSEDVSTEKIINLFHCLNELNDRSLVEQIQQSLRSGRLSEDELSPAQWSALAFILLSSEEDLDQFEMKKYFASEEALLKLLPVVKASNKALLSSCHLSERSCEALSTVLSSETSILRVLDLSNNDLKDSAVKMLSVGLRSPHCKLEQLRLSGCLISTEGCAALASALRSNPSHLKELDLSYNHPGDTGVRLLSALAENQVCALATLRLEPAGSQYLFSGPRKYFCDVTLDPDTAHRNLKVSGHNKKVTWVRKERKYQPHQDRFGQLHQILCSTALTGRCYWESNVQNMDDAELREDGESKTSKTQRPRSDALKADGSMGRWIELKREDHPGSEPEGLRSAQSIGRDLDFKEPEPQEERQGLDVSSDQQHPTQPDSRFKLPEADIVTFVQNELKKLQKVVNTDYPECLEPQKDEDEEQRSNSEAVLKITLNFLRRMKQKDLAERLSSRSFSGVCQRKLKSELQQKCECVFEGIAKAGNPTLLNQIYTELYITEGGSSEVNQEHEVRHMETASRKPAETPITCEDLFKGPADTHGPIRTVLTKGVAGIGKTVLTQKFSLDWAEGKANQDIQLLFPFTFRALNVMKDRSFSLVTLVHHFFSQTQAELCSFEDLQVLFIFDGLDECRLPLDFTKTKALTDPTESVSVDVLLVNLIRGSLLPSARLWITTRPAAANQIPAECVSMVTEVRGFKDPQKEQYFMKRFKEEANTIISHIKTSRSLHIMCHMPIFCWILSTVLEHVLKSRERGELPKTLTQMYIHFLVVQAKVKNVKYEEGSGTDSHWSPETRKMVESLGKLAFEQLQKGNLIFYESDLRECGLDAAAASVYSGVFTQVFREEPGLYQDKVYCFIHLSVQEFLAALHVHQTFLNSGINLMVENRSIFSILKYYIINSSPSKFYQTAVDQALQSPNVHLDLFLRFLLGLSLPSNQRLLQGLLTQTRSSSHTHQETAEYIKQKLSEDVSAESSINLFHCLNELNDRSLVEQIQQSLRSGRLSEGELSPAQWSALAFILLSSEEDLDQFELKKYSASEEALLWLLPVVKASNKALLSSCNLSERICEALSSVLSSQSSSLRVLDLSNNDLKDLGVKMLSVGLKSPHCKLEQLRLSGCLISEEGCAALASALRSNSSHLIELDLSFNHPGDTEAKRLSALQDDPHSALKTLRLKPAGAEYLRPGPKRFFYDLVLDLDTAHKNLKVSDDKKKVTRVKEEQPYPDCQDRFQTWAQILCCAGLTGCCYWEVQWSGRVFISVSYRGIRRRGDSDISGFGFNDQSWSLECSEDGFAFLHNNKQTPLQPCSSSSGTVAVFVDCPGGSLSFFTLSADKWTHLYTFNTTFTEPLFPGFGLGFQDSSVFLC